MSDSPQDDIQPLDQPRRAKSEKSNDDASLMKLAEAAVERAVKEEGAPEWVLTFGDMMSLLLCFFILMFAMSEVKLDKFLQASQSLRQGFGRVESQPSPELQSSPGGHESIPTNVQNSAAGYTQEIVSRMEDFINQNKLQANLEVNVTDIEVTLRIQDVVLFSPGSADIQTEARWLAEKLSKMVIDIGASVVVSGHTDNLPISTSVFPSNWELSSARAARMARVIIEQGFDPTRIQVVGFAEFSPVASNATAEARAKNRRVELSYTRKSIESYLDSGAGAVKL